MGILQGGLDIICHSIPDPFIGAESLCPCLGFAFGEGQTEFLLQFLADADIPLQPLAVGDAFAVVVHTVEYEVTMGIGFRSTWRQSSDRRGRCPVGAGHDG